MYTQAIPMLMIPDSDTLSFLFLFVLLHHSQLTTQNEKHDRTE
jgi:hypothetical protein